MHNWLNRLRRLFRMRHSISQINNERRTSTFSNNIFNLSKLELYKILFYQDSPIFSYGPVRQIPRCARFNCCMRLQCSVEVNYFNPSQTDHLISNIFLNN